MTEYQVSAKLSADEGQTLRFGSDGGILGLQRFQGVKAFGLGGTIPASDVFKLCYQNLSATQGGQINMAPDSEWPANSWILYAGLLSYNMNLNAPDGAVISYRGLSTGGSEASVLPVRANGWALIVKVRQGEWFAVGAG